MSSSDKKPQLYYFNAPGRAEVIRLVFAATGTAFEDVRFPRDQWPEQKKLAPSGVVPYVKTADKGSLIQSGAIARYYAKLGGLMGSNDWEYYLIERVLAQGDDIMQEIVKLYSTPEDKRPAAMKEFKEDKGQRLLSGMVQFLKENEASSKSCYFVGKSLSLADLAMIALLDTLDAVVPDHVATNFFELVQHKQKVLAGNARVAEWMKNRPK